MNVCHIKCRKCPLGLDHAELQMLVKAIASGFCRRSFQIVCSVLRNSPIQYHFSDPDIIILQTNCCLFGGNFLARSFFLAAILWRISAKNFTCKISARMTRNWNKNCELKVHEKLHIMCTSVDSTSVKMLVTKFLSGYGNNEKTLLESLFWNMLYNYNTRILDEIPTVCTCIFFTSLVDSW